MPACPSKAFLLWHEAQLTGEWRKLLDAPANPDRLMALWLLQSLPLRPVPAQEGAEDAGARAKAILAAGWGQ